MATARLPTKGPRNKRSAQTLPLTVLCHKYAPICAKLRQNAAQGRRVGQRERNVRTVSDTHPTTSTRRQLSACFIAYAPCNRQGRSLLFCPCRLSAGIGTFYALVTVLHQCALCSHAGTFDFAITLWGYDMTLRDFAIVGLSVHVQILLVTNP